MHRTRHPTSGLFTLAAILVAIAALYFAKEILLPLALATLISFLLTPLCDRLERLGLGRVPSVISVVGVSFLALGIISWIVMSQLVDLSVELPNYRTNVIEKIRGAMPRSNTLQRLTDAAEDVQKELVGDESASESTADAGEDPSSGEALVEGAPPTFDPQPWFRWGRSDDDKRSRDKPVDVRVVGMAPSPLAQVYDWLGPLVAPLTTGGIAIVLVIFILIRREDQRNRLLMLFGGSNLLASTEALSDVTERVSRYLRMQFLINAGYGICVGVGLTLLGLPNGVMWGVLSFSLRFLPYVGPWLSAIMPLIVSVAISPGWSQPVFVLLWFGILELLVNNVAEPLLYGPSIGLSGVGVIVAAVFWTWIWGPVGLVLAMPLTVCLVVLARYIPALRFLTIALSDQPSLAVEERIYQRLLAWDIDEARQLALERLEECSLDELFDKTLIPALRLAEQDRHAELLSDEQAEQIQESTRDLVEELGDIARQRNAAAEASPPPELTKPRLRVMCIPLRDEADATSAAMLKQLVQDAGITAQVSSVQALTGELVESVGSEEIDVVVISVVPPAPPRISRLLYRRLRDRYPDLPILLGCWNGQRPAEMRERLAAPEDAEVYTTLGETAQRLRAIASHHAEPVVRPA